VSRFITPESTVLAAMVVAVSGLHAQEKVPDAIGRDAPPAFAWPVDGPLVVPECGSEFSYGQNPGINILARRGAVVRAAADGVVAYAGNELKGYGNLVLIRHGNGWVTAYAFNSELLVKRGDEVRQGQAVAVVGRDATGSFPELHFEARRGVESFDPLAYLPNRKPASDFDEQ
jgi:murein DD-endopeptidase MepM/ murein hydrolase activator NlpD